MDNRPIGVFDSGVGGLTVAKEIMEQIPNEKIIYFGDTARVPYGNKSKETVTKYSKQIIKFLQTKDVKAIVIACGTASSNALAEVQEAFELPILGVVKPGANMAARTTKNNRIGIIGTKGTIRSKTYDDLIININKNITVIGQACPLFVPLAEEGWIDDKITYDVAKKYLRVFKDKDIDTLVLGCTHYPLLKKVIGDIMGDKVTLVNPAYETAKKLKQLLKESNITSSLASSHEFYVSDMAQQFEEFAKHILDKPMMPVKQINIEEY